MPTSREQILEQNQKDKAYFASFSPLVQDALGAQATVVLDFWHDVCVVQVAHLRQSHNERPDSDLDKEVA